MRELQERHSQLWRLRLNTQRFGTAIDYSVTTGLGPANSLFRIIGAVQIGLFALHCGAGSSDTDSPCRWRRLAESERSLTAGTQI